MEWIRYREVLRHLGYGKILPTAIYLHRDSEACQVGMLAEVVTNLARRHSIGADFNVIKFRTDAPRLSFLSYPRFDEDPHPALHQAFAVDLETGRTYSTNYQDNLNPPILHRKELLLSPGDPRVAKFAPLSAAEEEAGLFTNTTIIGFRLNWERILASSGFTLEGHSLIRGGEKQNGRALDDAIIVRRHKTALTRYTLSKPVKTLVEYDQLRPDTTFFDYGCGLGADVRGLRELGYDAGGWDPVHAPDGEKLHADIVNLGYVLNVIEDPAERLETLAEAWRLTRRLLIVSALVGDPNWASAVSFQDGFLTQRQTFQKYFNQQELQHYVEDALDAATIPVSLGILYVFRDSSDHQTFVQSRFRRAVDWNSLIIRSTRKELTRVIRAVRPPRPNRYEQHRELLEEFWASVLQLGRYPLPSEFGRHGELVAEFGSDRRALRLLLARGGQPLLETAQATRKNDLLVYLASGNLRKRIPFQQLAESTRADISTFFGSYKHGLDEGLKLVHSAADPETIVLACDDATVGWQDERNLYVSTGLIERLPIVLRTYVACGELLFGDATQADLVKIHKFSGKVTFLSYFDFELAFLPKLVLRTKVDLRSSRVDVFDHRDEGQLLYFKERFLAVEHSQRPALLELSGALRELGIRDTDFFGPTAVALRAILKDAGRSELAEEVFYSGEAEPNHA